MIFRKLSANKLGPIPFISNYKNRPWVLAATILAAVLQNLFIPALYLGGRRMGMVSLGLLQNALWNRMQSVVTEWFGASLVIGTLFILALTVFSGIDSFSYLFRQQTVDFYDCQPVSHRKRFFGNYFSGIWLYAAVSGLGTLIEALVICLSGGGYRGVYIALVLRYLRFLACYAGMYSIFALAAVLSGNVFIAVLMGAFLSVVETILRSVLLVSISTYYATSDMLAYDSWLWPRSLPFYYLFRHVGDFFFSETDVATEYLRLLSREAADFGPEAGASLLIAVIAAAIAYLAFINRPRESAGKGLCFSKAESVVKIITAVCTGIYAGILADSLFHSVIKASMLSMAVVVLLVVLVCLIAECVFSLNLSKALYRWWQIPVCAVAAIAWLLGFKFDVTGFDRYVPEASSVESATFYSEGAYTYAYITTDSVDGLPVDRDEYLQKNLRLKNVEDVCAVAEIGMQEQKKYTNIVTDWNYENTLPKEVDASWIAMVQYHMKDGRTIRRRLRIPFAIDEAKMNALLGSEDYKNTYFNLDDLTKALKQYMAANKKYTPGISYDNIIAGESARVSMEQVEQFLEAYRKDLKQYDFSYSQAHIPLGTAAVGYYAPSNTGEDSQMEHLPIYEGYDNSIAFLKQIGVYFDPMPAPEDVGVIGVLCEKFDEEGNRVYDKELDYTEPEKIEALMKAADISYSGEWNKTMDYSLYYSIRVVGQKDAKRFIEKEKMGETEVGTGFTVFGTEAPSFLKEDFEE
ncbi:MAG: hypothetical protein IJV04_04280 [Lachnospiraceae bacterium]|nr:hypothetical protein [Lachnospiraceae bacterium]